MRKELVIWICMLILLVVGVSAMELSPTVQTETQAGTQGIYIEYPQIDYYTMGDGINLSFHVFNSTGFLLNDSNTICQVHIYSHGGQHIINAPAANEADDFVARLGPNVTGTTGIYPLLIYCSNAKEAGFISTRFEIQLAAPVENSVGGFPLAVLILVPLLFGILLLVGSFMFGEDHAVLKIALFLFAYLTVFLSLWFGVQTVVRYYGFADLQEAIGTTVWIIGILFFVIVSYFLIYAFIQGVEAAAQKKKKELEY
jgi:hypothetical protein